MKQSRQSPASKVMDEAIELAIEERSPYPERSTFLNADTPSLAQRIRRSFDDGFSVVLVFPDGSTRILHADSAAA